uniref:inositol-pentakisphosphate 2-kinase n=1 Tax=Stomoxys calcitrans TaxID=35570 RepID=A0A1I8Q5N4_STOCA
MASEASSYASSCLQSNKAPKELLELLDALRQAVQHQHPQHLQGPSISLGNPQGMLELQQQQQQQEQLRQQQTLQHGRKPRMELSQIELIYRAEGNANLVLALPQFKKVLRLPKIQLKCQQQQQHPSEHGQSQLQLQHIAGQQQELQHQENPFGPKYPEPNKQKCQKQELEQQQQEQEEQPALEQQEPTNMILTTISQQQFQTNAVGILTMDHYVAYIGIIRCLLGNEFVFEADIVAVPNPNDREWINEHIRPFRPANRLDKEFGGHYGLLLSDATQLPTEFDILFSNLQPLATEASSQQSRRFCTDADGTVTDSSSDAANDNIFLEDTYAIEIKPKQGWLLPNDVNNLFDIKPRAATTTETHPTQTETTVAAKRETPTPTPLPPQTRPESVGTLETSAYKEYFTTTQNEASLTTTAAGKTSPTPVVGKVATVTKPSTAAPPATPPYDKADHPFLHDEVDIRCRYCSMQFLKFKQGKINQRSNYCPLDLFSGVPDRMWNALHALFMCPQNNLRIFKNGIVVFDDQLSRLSKIEDLFPSEKLQLIKHLLVTSLLKDYGEKEQSMQRQIANKEAIVCGKDEMSKAHKEVKASAADEKSDSSIQTHGTQRRCVDGKPHIHVMPSKEQKVNISKVTTAPMAMATATTTPETEAELVVTKVNTTFTNAANTIKSSHPTATTASNILVRPLRGDHSSLPHGSSYCCTASFGTDVSLGQMLAPEMLNLPKNCVLQKILHLQLLAKVSKALTGS